MQSLQYKKPRSLDEALSLMSEHAGKIKPYAGGTDLMVQLRAGEKRAKEIEILLDCAGIVEMRGIEQKSGWIQIGAMTTHMELTQSELIQQNVKFLADAAATVGSPQIRNVATIGGNVLNGSPAADTVSPLAALDAVLIVHSKDGMRECPMGDTYCVTKEVRLAPDELVTKIVFPELKGYQTVFLKVGRRKALAISRLNVAVALKLERGVITGARIAPGCVFVVPERVERAEALLLNEQPERGLFEEVGKAVAEEMVRKTGVRWSTDYKKPVLTALTQRALMLAAGFSEGETYA